MLSRRGMLSAAAGMGTLVAAAGAAAKTPARPRAADDSFGLRGTLDAEEAGLRAGSADDQSARFQAAIERAAREGRVLLLGPGRYVVGGIALPDRAAIRGVPGETRLAFSGGARFLASAPGATRLRLDGLALDGRHLPLGGERPALLALTDVARLAVNGCTFTASAGSGLVAERCGGRVSGSTVDGVADVGLWSRDGTGVAVHDNDVAACGNTGILVSRGEKGDDPSTVTANRVSRIDARGGGTGQNGNGINVDRASGVGIADNHVSDCLFSAVRVFSADNCRILSNAAFRSGETALYVEFASVGAIVSDNLVDGAANGIAFANFAEHGGRLGVCSGNLVRDIRATSTIPTEAISRYGIGIGAEADVAITGNTVETVARIGIQLGWGPHLRDLVASGNIIRDAPIGIAVSVVEGVGGAMVSGNLVSGASAGAIVGRRWDETVTGDLAVEASPLPRIAVLNNLATQA